jgi:hypothetical protein
LLFAPCTDRADFGERIIPHHGEVVGKHERLETSG